MKLKFTVASLLLVLAASNHIVFAGQDAQHWLMKMGRAAQDINYRGTFVYQHDLQLESMQIIHRVKRGVTTERLLSLNNSPREIIRDNNIIRCYLPDENSVVIEHRKANDKNFPRILPNNLKRLKDNYAFKLGPRERIADRISQNVIIKPADKYRYGYHLWADVKSGLLLKSDLVDANGNVLEQFMFTNLEIGGAISDADLKPRSTSLGLKKQLKTENKPPLTKNQWQVSSLPKGFITSVHMKRLAPMHGKSIEHLVISDGLAAVSVFIEKMTKSGEVMSGANSMGAVNAFISMKNGSLVTVVGEVPAVTVKVIADAVKPAK